MTPVRRPLFGARGHGTLSVQGPCGARSPVNSGVLARNTMPWDRLRQERRFVMAAAHCRTADSR
jgi:hypothetical protein